MTKIAIFVVEIDIKYKAFFKLIFVYFLQSVYP